MTREEVLKTYTLDAAYACFRESEKIRYWRLSNIGMVACEGTLVRSTGVRGC